MSYKPVVSSKGVCEDCVCDSKDIKKFKVSETETSAH